MRRPTRNLLVLCDCRILLARIHEAGKDRFSVTAVASWDDLLERAQSLGPTGVALVHAHHGRRQGTGLAPELQSLLLSFPSLTVLAAIYPRDGWIADACTLGQWGVSAVIDLETHNTPVALRRHLESARGRRMRSFLERGIPVPLSGRGRAVLDAALETVASGGTPRDIAAALRVPSSTLVRWCRGAGLPVPRRLIAWMRLLLAAEILDDPGQQVMSAALSCGYASDRVLRRIAVRLTSHSPAALRRLGAFRTVANAFQAALLAESQ